MSQMGAFGAGGGGGGSIDQITTDDGIAVPNAGNINIVGGINVTTEGAGDTVVINANEGSQVVHYTEVTFADSPYIVMDDDYYISVDVSGGAVSILLPDATDIGRIFTIKDQRGLSTVDNITVTTVSGAVTIDGALFFDMNNNYEALAVLFGNNGYEIF